MQLICIGMEMKECREKFDCWRAGLGRGGFGCFCWDLAGNEVVGA